MNWNANKSVKLSKFCIWLFSLLLLAMVCSAPWLFSWLIDLRGLKQNTLTYFLISFYLSVFPVGAIFWQLHLLLRNIGRGEIFCAKNIALLRSISWACILVGLICLVSTVYYPPFLFIALPAPFVGLIVRVVKNVMEEAAEIKAENDYTI